jgi:hypothetical protein
MTRITRQTRIRPGKTFQANYINNDREGRTLAHPRLIPNLRDLRNPRLNNSQKARREKAQGSPQAPSPPIS